MPANQARATRGRVVMLVDNDVRGDSRVQKEARSMAAAGWEVFLLGERRDSPLETWMIGDAEVRLVPMNDALNSTPMLWRRSLLRPLAYPIGRESGYRLELVKARHAELTTRFAQLNAKRREGGSAAAHAVGKAALLPVRVTHKALSVWTRFRAGEMRRMRQFRRDSTHVLNRAQVKLWQTAMGDRAWRRLDPSLWQWELAFRKSIDKLQPDIIHANDFRMLGVGARAKIRARAKGRDTKLVWDAHEYAPGLVPKYHYRWLPAITAHEAEFAPYADAVVTVSPSLADLLKQEHGLATRPDVVMNAPVQAPAADESAAAVPDLRTDCGIGPDVPLLAYVGGITPVRGVDIIIDALPHLPEVHVALVSVHPNGKNPLVDKLVERAVAAGVADRVHALPYVPHWQVSDYLRPADAAVSPLHHLPNHEIALSNKFFEYSHARLPLITSDIRTMAEMVRSTGQGEVFKAEDLDDFVRVVRLVLADPDKYRAAYDKDDLLLSWTWEAQAAVLDRVYTQLMPATAAVTEPVVQAAEAPTTESLPQAAR
jgi:glycosyltransferase involved in cell wall biosynthesis